MACTVAVLLRVCWTVGYTMYTDQRRITEVSGGGGAGGGDGVVLVSLGWVMLNYIVLLFSYEAYIS